MLYSFEDNMFHNKRVVVLIIPAAKLVPTEFSKERYIRIGSSNESLRKFPLIEASLWDKSIEEIKKLIPLLDADLCESKEELKKLVNLK